MNAQIETSIGLVSCDYSPYSVAPLRVPAPPGHPNTAQPGFAADSNSHFTLSQIVEVPRNTYVLLLGARHRLEVKHQHANEVWGTLERG